MASLADRITKPDSKSEGSSWADETTNAAAASAAPSDVKAKAERDMSQMDSAQTDGAGAAMGGSSGIVEPHYDVDVKLSDLQADPNDPLFSAKSFEELGLCVAKGACVQYEALIRFSEMRIS